MCCCSLKQSVMIFVRKRTKCKNSRLIINGLKARLLNVVTVWLIVYSPFCPTVLLYDTLSSVPVVSTLDLSKRKAKKKKQSCKYEALPLSAQVMHTERGIKFTHSVPCAFSFIHVRKRFTVSLRQWFPNVFTSRTQSR